VALLAAMLLLFVFAVPAWGVAEVVPPENEVVMQLSLVIDGSSSVTAFGQLKQALADAVRDGSLVPRNGVVELTVVLFGTGDIGWDAEVVSGPTVVTDSTYEGIAQDIEAMEYPGHWTPIGQGIRVAVEAMEGSPNSSAPYRVINLFTDGHAILYEDGYGEEWARQRAEEARAEAIAAGITEIDAEIIPSDDADEEDWNWLRDNIVYPTPDPENCCFPEPHGSTGFFCFVGDDFGGDYAAMVRAKFEYLMPRLSLVPLEESNPVYTEHTVYATYQVGGEPQNDVPITFAVVGGPNAGATGTGYDADGNPVTDTNVSYTDESGVAAWTYTDTGGPGTDTIMAFVDENVNGTYDAGETASNEVTKHWKEEPSIPGLTGWGMAGMAAVFALVALLVLRRRRVARAVIG